MRWDIREALIAMVEQLRGHADHTVIVRVSGYWSPIHPSWLETPETRARLWVLMERLVALEAVK